MTRAQPTHPPAADASLPGQIDQWCDAFEEAWQRGTNPRLEDFLHDFPEPARDRAFRELLEVEIAYRRRAGEGPTAAEYLLRFPQFEPAIDAFFSRTIPYSDAATATQVQSDGSPGVDAPTMPPGSAEMKCGAPTGSAGGNDNGAASPVGQRFRVLRSFARGGLGEVLVAEDLELHREVALKQIQLDYADDEECRSRFVLEAEITGRLEHPGVVPVYGLGKYGDGRPYYAMRFIRGGSLKEAIAQYHAARRGQSAGEQSLALRKLLGRFVDVCDVIEYAHSRGIVHRDLKPANIMLGRYGETLVVDWGLAKVVGQPEQPRSTQVSILRPTAMEQSSPTQIGRVVGTPQYMSPEQAAGRTDRVGPASDVYGLGATFYCLLTGRPPFSDRNVSLEEILLLVEQGDVFGPRQLNSAVPKPLDAICRKAMARKATDRYASPRALADDIEHWLADEPIKALPDRIAARAARWIRRHRRGAYTTALALFVVSVVSLIALALVNQQRKIADDLALANAQLAAKAQAARDDAETAFRQARDAVDDLFTRVSEETLLNQPGLQGIRKELLEKTLDYYKRFVASRQSDPAVQDELAATLFKIGRIVDEVQSPDQAVPYLNRAKSMQQELLDRAPHDPKRLQALGDTENALGRALHRSQLFTAAQEAYQRAKDLRQQLVAIDPHDHEYARMLANVEMNIGVVEKDSGQFAAADRDLDAAQRIRERQSTDGGDSPKLQRDLAMGSYNQGVLAMARVRPATAANYFAEAIKRFEQLARGNPRDLNLQFLLATCYRQLADLQSVEGPADESIRLYGLARDNFARLADRNPDVSEYPSALAGVYMNLARRQPPAAAMASFKTATELLGELAEHYPGNPQFRRDLAVALRSLGGLQLADGQRDEALKNLKRSVKTLEALVKALPENKEFAAQLTESRKAADEAEKNTNPH